MACGVLGIPFREVWLMTVREIDTALFYRNKIRAEELEYASLDTARLIRWLGWFLGGSKNAKMTDILSLPGDEPVIQPETEAERKEREELFAKLDQQMKEKYQAEHG